MTASFGAAIYVTVARWCTTGKAEQLKCEALTAAVAKRIDEKRAYPKKHPAYTQLPTLKCVQAVDQFDCMQKISNDEADLIQLDPGIGYTGGQYFNLMPLMAESYSSGEAIREEIREEMREEMRI